MLCEQLIAQTLLFMLKPVWQIRPLHGNPSLFKRTRLALPKRNKQNFKDCGSPAEMSFPFERSLLVMQMQSYLHR